ncbi:MAG: hypothetical protein WCC90_17285 [Methylocella sp.]
MTFADRAADTLKQRHAKESDIMADPTVYDRLNDFIVHGDLLVDIVKEVLRVTFIGALLSVGNLFLTERRELQHANRIKSYAELVNLRDTAKRSNGKIGKLDAHDLDERIEFLEKIMHVREDLYDSLDKIYSNVLTVIAFVFFCMLLVLSWDSSKNKLMLALIWLATVLCVCVFNYFIGKHVSGALDKGPLIICLFDEYRRYSYLLQYQQYS